MHIFDINSSTVYFKDIQLPAEQFPYSASWTVLSNGNLIYTGGYPALKLAWEIDLIEYTVKEHTAMIEGREGHGICNFKDVIYVFGGNGPISSAEKFDFGQTWELIAPLSSKRSRVSCLVHKDHIYISGKHSTVTEIYHPATNSYQIMSSVLPSDSASIMMAVSGQHYIFRGDDFLRLNCDQGRTERLAGLPYSYWWS